MTKSYESESLRVERLRVGGRKSVARRQTSEDGGHPGEMGFALRSANFTGQGGRRAKRMALRAKRMAHRAKPKIEGLRNL